ncbi:MAG TPA: hypothetical protein VGJ86_23790 [Acidimicrobiales bacterium]|jgi:hypothetical protein
MAKGAIATEFRRNETVKTLDDLPGVPQGTSGQVLLVDGFTWTRYRVAFDNGYDLGSIDGQHLSRASQYDAALAHREELASSETAAADAVESGDGGEAGASVGDAVVNGVTIPAHLLERSKRARERLTAA